MCVCVCVSVCPDVRYARPHLWTDFFETWQGGTWAFWAPAKLYGDDVTSGSVTSHGRERDDPPLRKPSMRHISPSTVQTAGRIPTKLDMRTEYHLQSDLELFAMTSLSVM